MTLFQTEKKKYARITDTSTVLENEEKKNT